MTVAYALEIHGHRGPARFSSAVLAAHVAAEVARIGGLTVDTDVRVIATFDR